MGNGNEDSPSNVRVVARIRPLFESERNRGSSEVVSSLQSKNFFSQITSDIRSTADVDADNGGNNDNIRNSDDHHDSNGTIIKMTDEPELVETVSWDGKRWFELDAVFDQSSSQEEVYVRSGASSAVRNDLFSGVNVTILAYGQTGSGKTYTMGSSTELLSSGSNNKILDVTEDTGLIPRACVDLFVSAQEKCCINEQFDAEFSYLEIYNEEINDLLAQQSRTSGKLKIRETFTNEVYVEGLTTRKVSSPHEIYAIMEEASHRRVVAATSMNAESSRSHAIATLRISGTLESPKDDRHHMGTDKFNSKLTLVDLAGSERMKRTGAKGDRRQEGININKGLFVLGQVISALTDQGQNSTKKKMPPYRDSKLTRLLQMALGGNSRTIMLACVSPTDSDLVESVNTLRYASNARNIQNNVTHNIENSLSPQEQALQHENEKLKNQLSELQLALKKIMPVAEVAASSTALTEEESSSSSSGVDDDNDDEGSSSRSSDSAEQPDESETELQKQQAEQDSRDEEIELLRMEVEKAKLTAEQVPILQLELAKLRSELDTYKEVAKESEQLKIELKEAKTDAASAKMAASKLSDTIDQLSQLKKHEIKEMKEEFDRTLKKKSETWSLVDTMYMF